MTRSDLSFAGAAVAVAVVGGALSATGDVKLIVAAILGAGLFALAVRNPQWGAIVWVIGMVFIPNWTTLHLGPLILTPTSALALPILAGSVVFLLIHNRKVTLHWMDGTLVVAGVAIVLQAETQFLASVLVKEFALVWVVGYVFGRMANEQVQRVLVRVLVVVAIWGIVEFVLGIHVFENWFPSANHHWGDIQERAGVARSEATFGHAIAYGAALAMAIPLAQRLPRHPLVAQVILAAGVICSLSRGPLASLAVGLVLVALVVAASRQRFRYLLIAVSGSAAIYYVFGFLYGGSDAATVALSGDQRSVQFEAALRTLNWLTPADGFGVTAEGRYAVNGVDVIDSTPLRIAVNFGIITAVLLLLPIGLAVWRILTRKAGVASVALATQIPTLIVTSLITQWSALVFVAMGMVVSEAVRAKQRPTAADLTESEALRGSPRVLT